MNFFKTQSKQNNARQTIELPIERLRADVLNLSQTVTTLKANYIYRGTSDLRNAELLDIVAVQLKTVIDRIDDSYGPQRTVISFLP